MKYIFATISFVLCSLIFNAPGNAEEKATKIYFEDVVKFESKGKLIVTDRFKKGTTFLLLGEDSTTCLAEASNSEMLEDAPDPFEITNLNIEDKCKPQNYIGALVGATKANYQYIKLKPLKDSSLTNRIYTEAKMNEHPKCPAYLQLTNSLIKLWVIPNPKERLVLAQIKRKTNANGPLLIQKDNHIYSLKGGCTNEMKTFSLNNRIYLRYVETGCDGGLLVTRVYDISGNGPELVYSNDKWST
ncbi:MAG: hypothetical protein V2B20_01920 [Pseudomonadota bacterium]